jgi:hypothetical protein
MTSAVLLAHSLHVESMQLASEFDQPALSLSPLASIAKIHDHECTRRISEISSDLRVVPRVQAGY